MDLGESDRSDWFDRLSVPESGEVLSYQDGFRSPEAPIVPVAHGADDAVIAATRRVLDAAVDLMGREIHWLEIYLGEEATARYDEPLPEDTVRALQAFRIGLLGSPTDDRLSAHQLHTELQRRLGLTAAIERRWAMDWLPSPLRSGRGLDLTVVRDLTEDAAAGIEYPPDHSRTQDFRDCLRSTAGDSVRLPDGPTAYNVRPFSAAGTHTLVDIAMEYAFDRDRNTVTVAQGDARLPASEGSFRDWARAHLDAGYAESTIDEATFREDNGGTYPEEELVIRERTTHAVCREVMTRPPSKDVVVAPAMAGLYISAVAAEAMGGLASAPGLAVGDGLLLATSDLAAGERAGRENANPISSILSGCELFEYIGWEDTATMIRGAISAALADGHLPPDVSPRSERGSPVRADEFAEAVIERLSRRDRRRRAGGVPTTADERARIRRIIAGVHNIVFADQIAPDDIELNQLLGADEEAAIYLPEVGLNFAYWRRWSPERRLEVLLHELAHVEEEPGERDHGDEFYDRFVELTEIAADWQAELEALLDTSIEMAQVRRCIIESVHEETIEPDLDTVRQRRRMLRERFDLDAAEHF